MKAAIMTGEKKIDLFDITLPEIGADEVLVKVDSVGLCTMEQKVYFGRSRRYPFAGGHEIVGFVEKVGTKVMQKLVPGEAVSVISLTRCGQCYTCRKGYDNQCECSDDVEKVPGYPGPGGFAEYFIAKDYEVYKLRKNMLLDLGTLAEPLSCVVHSMDAGKPKEGDYCLVCGAGFMGVLHLLLLKHKACRVIVSEPNALRRRKALEFGADWVVDPLTEKLPERIREITDGHGCERAFFTAGGKAGIEQAIASLAIRGVLVIYGSTGPNDQIVLDPKIFHYREITITGVVKHTKSSIQRAVELLSDSSFGFERLITSHYSFNDLNAAFEKTHDAESYRVLAKW